MTSATAAAPGTPAISRSLRQRRGLFLAYRLAWAALLVAALSTLGRLVTATDVDPAVLALRLVKAAVLVAVSVILFRRRQSDAVAAMLSLALLLWTITSSFDFSNQASTAWPVVLDRLRFLLFVSALLLFPNGEWRPSWTRKVAIASCAVSAVGISEAVGLLGTRLYLPLAIACVLAALHALLLRYRTSSSDAEKQQLKWVALGLTSGISLILAARAGAASGAEVAPILLECLFQLGIIVLAVGFLISLLRYRLYDAEAVISRSAAYAVLTLALVATFAASEALIEMFGEHWFGAGIGNVSGAMAAAVAAVLLTPLHGRISAWAERRFQADLILLKEQLPELLAELSGSSSPARIALAALPRIEEAVHAAHSALVVDGKLVAAHGVARQASLAWLRDWQALAPTSPLVTVANDLFPLRLALRCPFGSLRGWLLLGTRPDGSFYGRDDLDALRAILPFLRQALFAAREREKERARERGWQQSTREMLETLSDRVAALEARQAGARSRVRTQS